MRALLIPLTLLSLGGCAAMPWEPRDADGSAQDARRDAEARCPGGHAVVRNGADGRSAGDYECRRERPR